MALTDKTIRSAKPGDRDYKLADSAGLYLFVTTAGGKLWRMKYRSNGIERKLSFGPYPAVSLADARKARDAAREQSLNGQDPAAEKRRKRIAEKLSAATTFGGIANEFIEKSEREARAPATIAKLKWARDWLEPVIGNRPIAEITAHDILAILKRQEREGKLETAKRTRAFASRVFRYAVATGRTKDDPAIHLLGAIAAPKPKHLSAIVNPLRVGELLRAIDGYSGSPLTRLALSLMPHVFLRPGELRQAEWSEIDFDAAVWRVPASRMKMRREHVLPLSRQALSILSEVREISGNGQLVFPAQGNPNRPLSENTATAALRRMGFAADEMSAHGFRATASTLLNESGKWHPDAIERALAHKDTDKVRAAYHRGAHWDERVRMAQWWSDKLHTLRDGADIVQLLPKRSAT